MTPTITEAIFWAVVGIVALATLMIAPHINPEYDPKGDDPYRYCPKEDGQ